MVQKEVREYLRSGTEKGFSIKELKRELVKAGHEIKVVEESAKEFERKNAFKIIGGFLVVAVVSLVVIFGFKDLIFNEKNAVGTDIKGLNDNVNLNQECNEGEIKDCGTGLLDGISICYNGKFSGCISKTFDDCKLDNNEKYSLCCIKNDRVEKCSTNQLFQKSQYLIFKSNTKYFKDQIIGDNYHICYFTSLLKDKNNLENEYLLCSKLLNKDEYYLINVHGYLKANNLIKMFIYPKNIDLSTKNSILENKDKAREILKIEVNVK